MNKEIYKSSVLPPEGERLVVDTSTPVYIGGGGVLESFEAKIRRAEVKLTQVEKELQERTQRLQNIKEHITDEARIEAKKIIEGANREIEAQKGQLDQARGLAEEEGRKLGRDAGYQEGKDERARLLKQIEEILDTAKRKRDQIIKAAEEEVVNLAVLVAGKVIKREVKEDKQVAASNVKEALKKLTAKEEITIRVNIDEVAVVEEHKDEFLAQAKGLRTITFKEDSSIERGGCRIDTDFGSIDATISTQIEEIEKGLIQKANE